MTLEPAQQLFFAQHPNSRSFNSNASSTNATNLSTLKAAPILPNNRPQRTAKPGVQNSEKHAPTKENKDN